MLKKLINWWKTHQYDANDTSRMIQIDTVIADFQKISDRWGNTCVYIRRGGMAWGAVALNRQADDEKHGVFDLQAQHDHDMRERLEQVKRLKEHHLRDLKSIGEQIHSYLQEPTAANLDAVLAIFPKPSDCEL